jgi:hypothetical protein
MAGLKMTVGRGARHRPNDFSTHIGLPPFWSSSITAPGKDISRDDIRLLKSHCLKTVLYFPQQYQSAKLSA